VSLGRNNHSDGSRFQSMRNIRAVSFRVPSHISGPAPHSVRMCCKQSSLLQWSQRSVGVSLILRSLVRVGMMSWITLYPVTLTVSDNGASYTFFRMVAQSVFGHNRVIRITGDSADAPIRVYKVLYDRRLCALWDSDCSWNERYAESCANMRKYSNCAGIRYMYGRICLPLHQVPFPKPFGCDRVFISTVGLEPVDR